MVREERTESTDVSVEPSHHAFEGKPVHPRPMGTQEVPLLLARDAAPARQCGPGGQRALRRGPAGARRADPSPRSGTAQGRARPRRLARRVLCGMRPGEPGRRADLDGRLKTFYRTFAVPAPVPSIIFAKHYARLAAQVRWKLGFGACGPREYPLFTSARRAVQQAIVIAIGLAPLAIVWHLIPFLGEWISKLVFGAWAVHWVVVDAYDDARVLLPGETVKSAEETDRRAPSPWFVRAFLHGADKIPFRPVAGLLRKFARFCDRLALPWRGEFALMEGQPFISTGFALMTATLLAVPVMNLLFRPIILVASSHLLGHLEAADPATQHPGMPVAPRALPGR